VFVHRAFYRELSPHLKVGTGGRGEAKSGARRRASEKNIVYSARIKEHSRPLQKMNQYSPSTQPGTTPFSSRLTVFRPTSMEKPQTAC